MRLSSPTDSTYPASVRANITGTKAGKYSRNHDMWPSLVREIMMV